jgi:hypothetical protein
MPKEVPIGTRWKASVLRLQGSDVLVIHEGGPLPENGLQGGQSAPLWRRGSLRSRSGSASRDLIEAASFSISASCMRRGIWSSCPPLATGIGEIIPPPRILHISSNSPKLHLARNQQRRASLLAAGGRGHARATRSGGLLSLLPQLRR